MNNDCKQQAYNILQNILNEINQNELVDSEYSKLYPLVARTIDDISEKNLSLLMMEFRDFGLEHPDHYHVIDKWNTLLNPLIRDYVKMKAADLIKRISSYDF